MLLLRTLGPTALALCGCTFGGGSAGVVDEGSGDTRAVGDESPPVTTLDGVADPDTSAGTVGAEGSSSGGASTAAVEGDSTAAGTRGSGTGEATTGTTGGTGTGGAPSFGPFGDPVPIAELNHPVGDDDDPSVRSDELEIYFDSDRFGGHDFMVARRDAVTDEWGPVEVEADLSSPAGDTTPALSDDGLVMLLSSTRSSMDNDIFISTRETWDDPWSTPEQVPDLSSPVSDYGPTLFDAELFLCRTGPDMNLQVWRHDVVDLATASFGEGEFFDVFNVEGGHACTLTMSQDRLELFIERELDPTLLTPSFDLYRATREDDRDPWPEPELVDELNGMDMDNDPWLSQDGLRLYFASTRDGSSDLFVATRELQ